MYAGIQLYNIHTSLYVQYTQYWVKKIEIKFALQINVLPTVCWQAAKWCSSIKVWNRNRVYLNKLFFISRPKYCCIHKLCSNTVQSCWSTKPLRARGPGSPWQQSALPNATLYLKKVFNIGSTHVLKKNGVIHYCYVPFFKILHVFRFVYLPKSVNESQLFGK